jgi:hypothetical protein
VLTERRGNSQEAGQGNLPGFFVPLKKHALQGYFDFGWWGGQIAIRASRSGPRNPWDLM